MALGFSSSPNYANANSRSCDSPGRYRPYDDGNCGKNVAILVLGKYGIPYIGSPPPKGNLCGFDINNMPAAEAIQLSLLENLSNGKLYEMYTDENGFAYFEQIYPHARQSQVEIRTCIPTHEMDNKADLVIVRGYKPQPCRSFKDFVSLSWLRTDSLYYYADHCVGFSTEATRSYKDPVLETSYMDGVENLYDLKAFEQLVGYVIKFDGSTDPNVKYSFSNTTIKNIPLTVGTGFAGVQEVCNEDTLRTEQLSYAGDTYSLGNFTEVDKFGHPWPLFLSVQGLYAMTYEVEEALFHPYYVGAGSNSGWTVIMNPKRKFISVPASNWHWTLTTRGSPNVHFYSRVPTETETNAWTTGSDPIVGHGWSDGGIAKKVPPPGFIMPNLGGSWVSVVTRLWAAVELDRPSVVVSDPGGDAIGLANRLNVEYQPIIVVDEPAVVAYHGDIGSGVVDHSLDLYDSDPSTVQDPPENLERSLSWLQTQTNGRTVDISLPFLDEGGCIAMAKTIYDMQYEKSTTYSMVCGPDSEPKLGTRVEGYEGRIEKISYSYTDSSAYNINITVGPTFSSVKGGGGNVYNRKTEDVSREAIVIWDAGNGVDYRVRIQGGLGCYNAINMTLNAYNIGEKVSVTVHNNPVEK